MALKFNSTTISSSYTPKFNGTALKSIKYGSAEVWKSGYFVFSNGSWYNGYSLSNWNNNFSGQDGYFAPRVSGSQLQFFKGWGLQNIWSSNTYPTASYKTLTFKVAAHTDTVGLRIGVHGTSGQYNDDFTKFVDVGAKATGTFTIDISSITSNMYIKMRPLGNNSAQGYIGFSEIVFN